MGNDSKGGGSKASAAEAGKALATSLTPRKGPMATKATARALERSPLRRAIAAQKQQRKMAAAREKSANK